jgi:DNA 3'-phosphatase
MKIIKGLFLDLDSTLIRTVSGKMFPQSHTDWQWYNKHVMLTLRRHMDYGIFIVTNQGGIEKGFVNETEFLSKISSIVESVQSITDNSVPVQGYYCPKMESYDRKPLPGMAFQAARDFNINLKDSIMVGDMESDAEFAYNAGIGTFYHPDEFFVEFRPDLTEMYEAKAKAIAGKK